MVNIYVFLVVVLTTLMIVVGVLFWVFNGTVRYGFDKKAEDGSYQMTVAPDVREAAREISRKRESALGSSVEIRINGEPEVDAESRRCNLLAGNPENNEKDFRVTVTLDEDGTIIYQSPVLKPGERLAYVTLDKALIPGEYPATAEFAVLDSDTGEALGAVDAGISLKVK